MIRGGLLVKYFGNLSNYLCENISVGTTRKLSSTLVADDVLLELLQPPKKPPIYEKDIVPEPKESQKVSNPSNTWDSKKRPQKESAVIQCKRPELNHYRNQKYDKFSVIPLVSKGWLHKLSRGDYFTINICDKADYKEGLFWENEKTFEELKLSPEIIQALQEGGITRPTKIQGEAIRKVLSGQNCLLTAETGCGKTLAYLLPALEQVLRWRAALPKPRPHNTPLVLILTPSRELAIQIEEVARQLCMHLPVLSGVVVGGRTKQKMLNPNLHEVDILVASLGAISKLTTTRVYNMSEVKHLILDEADTLLDDSFNELLLRYLKKFKIQYLPGQQRDVVPKNTQLTLVSATLPTSINDILQDFLQPDSFLKISTGRVHKVMPHVPQVFYRLGASDKPARLLHIAKEAAKKSQPTIVFSNKSKTCDWISLMLNENGVKTTQLNGEMPYIIRRGIFEDFQKGNINLLSCTDIASRGLDTTRVEHIVNYDFPLYMADYIHRCGRTGRVGSPHDCLVTNFVSGKREVDLVRKIELAVRTMTELPNVNGNITKIIQHRIDKSMQ